MELQTMIQVFSRPTERGIPRWRFVVPLMLQLVLILAVPMPKVAAYAWGTTALLEVAPVDPYDILRGRYVRLDYAVSGLETLRELHGWQEHFDSHGRTLFLTLTPGATGQAWRPVAIAEARPTSVPEGAVVLQGRMGNRGLELGLGEFHIPEGRGDDAETRMRRSPGTARAEVKVDGNGNAVLTGLWVEGQRY